MNLLSAALREPPKPTRNQLDKIKKWKIAAIVRDMTDPNIYCKIKILEHGGYAQFPVITKDGEVVSEQRIDTQYGIRWVINEQWYTESVHPDSKLMQDGFKIDKRWFPAWTKKNTKSLMSRRMPLVFKIEKPKYT